LPRSALRVLLVEDSETARRGLTEKLTEAGFRIAGEAASVAVARALHPRIEFDIALIDVYLQDGDGIELAAEMRAADAGTTIVLLTVSTKPNDLLRALRAGADGYLTKDFAGERLGESLRAAVRGETPISRAMTPVLVREFQRQNKARRARSRAVRERLTPREWQILTLLADGKSTASIASDLVVSVETVRSHVKAVMRKLQVHTRAAAIACLDELRDGAELKLAG
jgi:two-component system nitrate/nitrite response regulator NarL